MNNNIQIYVWQMENGENDLGIKEEQQEEDSELEEMVMARASKMAIVNEKVN